jgi:hypothetical protein
MPGFHNAHFLIPEILWRQLQKRAYDANLSMTSILSDAIQRYLGTKAKRTTATPATKRTSKKPTSKSARAGRPSSTR